jgi:hypothetical protein
MVQYFNIKFASFFGSLQHAQAQQPSLSQVQNTIHEQSTKDLLLFATKELIMFTSLLYISAASTT